MLLFCACLTGCSQQQSTAASAKAERPEWTEGFWLWNPTDAAAADGYAPDVLYVNVGNLRPSYNAYDPEPWHVYAELPERLPKAVQYWLVLRYENQDVPAREVIPLLTGRLRALGAEAERRGLEIEGVQLDIDSPTGRLDAYAKFLGEVRGGLPAGWRLSITALLDWFRDGTSIDTVIAAVDEFVPQFYDIGDATDPDRSLIAAPIDAELWGPRFARLGKPYRIGISTFGRARYLRNDGQRLRMPPVAGLSPLRLANDPAFSVEVSTNAAKETVLDYRAERETELGYQTIHEGDVLQFILPSAKTVRDAVDRSRQMPGPLAGVVFFRWPNEGETMAMRPGEVLEAAGVTGTAGTAPRVEAVDGGCAAVACVDLYFVGRAADGDRARDYRIQSSVGLEYFLPQEHVPVRMMGASVLELAMPAHAGFGKVHLGRAVTKTKAEYRVEPLP